jgi:hypothetical protein
MKRLVIAALLLLVPTLVFGTPSLGMYFCKGGMNAGQMHARQCPGMEYEGYIYAHHWGCDLTAAEFLVEIPSYGIIYTGFYLPGDNYLNIGDPLGGIAVTWYPPALAGEEFHLILTMTFYPLVGCWDMCGDYADMPIRILPHPDSQGIFGTCHPAQELFEFVGHTSIICPAEFAVENKSWGAIKAMYK